MSDETTTYGELIRTARTALNLRQRDLAERLGVTDGFITKLEKEVLFPSADILRSTPTPHRHHRRACRRAFPRPGASRPGAEVCTGLPG